LDLSALQSINGGFDDGPNSARVNTQRINASNGGLVRLSGLTMISTPLRPEDGVEISAVGTGSDVDVSSLVSVVGSGRAALAATDGGTLRVGSLAAVPSGSTLSLQGPGARVVAPHDLTPAQTLLVVASPGTAIELGGDLSFSYTDETRFALGQATMKAVGSGTAIDPQRFEIGGRDVDTAANVLSNDNFGAAAMMIGRPGNPTVVQLRDEIDNGNRSCSDREALYIGDRLSATPVDSLAIGPGSTLALRGLKAYAVVGGQWVLLNGLFSSTADVISFDQGFLRRTAADSDADGVLDDGDGSGVAGDHPCQGGLAAACDDNCPFAVNPLQEDIGGVGVGSGPDGIGNACQCGDVSGDGRVTIVDAVVVQRALLVPATAVMARPDFCDVAGSCGCSIADATAIRRSLLVPAAAQISQRCNPATP
jgi:hypothetical protein